VDYKNDLQADMWLCRKILSFYEKCACQLIESISIEMIDFWIVN
jgi:hypothetical protein